MSGKSVKEYEKQYTKPELRERLKEQIKADDKGGRKGQWSARKSQLLVHEYEAKGGGYKGQKKASQKSLEQWGKEEWQTKSGGTRARHGKTTERYLPKKAWESMSESEKKATDKKKRVGSRAGKQHVSNTPAAKTARRTTTARAKTSSGKSASGKSTGRGK